MFISLVLRFVNKICVAERNVISLLRIIKQMKIRTEEKREDFDTVKTFRTIKENISKDIWGLSCEELMKYLGELNKQE